MKCGALLAFDLGTSFALKTISKTFAGKIDAAIDFVGAESSASLSVNLVRRTGLLVIVGLNDVCELVALAKRETLPQIPLDLRYARDLVGATYSAVSSASVLPGSRRILFFDA